MEKRHSFTVKGYIEQGSPHLAWSISHVQADTIDDALAKVREMFRDRVMISDVSRIISRERRDGDP